MATKGIKLVTFALLDDAGKILTGQTGLSTNGLYAVTNEMLGTKSANVTNLSSAPTPIYGNDGQVDADIAKGTPSVAFNFNGLPVAIKHKLLGRISDAKGGYVQGKVPKVACLIQTTTVGTEDPQYVGFASGKMNEPAMNLQTNTNAVVRADDALTYTPLSVSRWGGEAAKFWDGGDAKFTEDAMMSDVFDGYSTTDTPVSNVTLNKTALSLAVGANETLTATVAPATATDKTVTFTSSDPAVATVDNQGKVVTVKVGTATITVTTANGKTATLALTVTAP